MKIYLMRHGETDLNRENKLQGQIDCPLNNTGIQQAIQAGMRLAEAGLTFDRVYSSPLKRAVETAVSAVGIARDKIICDERLIEIGYGPYEAVPFFRLTEDIFAFFRDPEHVATPEGIEPISDVVGRTGCFLKELSRVTDAENILVVTHGGVIRAILGHVCTQNKDAVWGMSVENCTLYEIRLVDGVYSI